ncbi:DNA translocase FtsK [Paramaledivibacter caminithermalis DSM 15212]|uniref:DNA translocase FtsK n=2 Tax=Paramaledivibacter TaxID=1884934 RepID=A0A1M6N4L9_PARC5|nr:DNA translocase FtsK [Paramaledivibacter caminithermalis]SHJ90661.1 DNA translocase FtsK [Paramaledivibacter caminithermalis DSM 15212]
MAKKRTRSKKKQDKKTEKMKEIKALIQVSFGIICIFSLHTNSVGKLGIFIKNLFMGVLSTPAYILPYLIIITAFFSLNSRFQEKKGKFMISFLSLYLCFIITYSLVQREYIPSDFSNYSSLKYFFSKSYWLGVEGGIGGGIIGNIITSILLFLFGVKGSYIIAYTIGTLAIILSTNLSLVHVVKLFVKAMTMLFEFIKASIGNLLTSKTLLADNEKKKSKSNKKAKTIAKNVQENTENNKDIVDEKIKILDYTSNYKRSVDLPKDNSNTRNGKKMKYKDLNENEEEGMTNINISENNNLENYKIPNIDLLNPNENSNSMKDKKDILNKAKILEETLQNFGVDAKVIQISKGPTITRYELQPKPGVKVSKIVNLSDDIALNLAAQNIRIEAPIPGKSAVGIEVPNPSSTLVTLREVIESDKFTDKTSKLTFVLGKDISGQPIVDDLAKMPHMLIAGATGSGKSVCVNCLITSILYKASPHEVKFLLIDPKVVELSCYNGIPHLLLPVVTDPKKAAAALNWVVQEMTNRYKLFAQNSVRDIDAYNEKIKDAEDEKLPKLVVIIDELADLMIVAPSQVEDAICRLAQMARAAGIHLIVATQRPSVDVITGVIKANIPSRIAFAVSSGADSRTILDMGGAEKLLGKGDMLFYPVGSSKPQRIQGAFVSDGEVNKVVEFIKNQVEDINYEEDIIEKITETQNSKEEEVDELLSDAIDLVIDTQQASISMLQRKFRIGYNRAARIIDEMESRGIVSENLGSKPRNVLISKEEFKEIKSKTS